MAKSISSAFARAITYPSNQISNFDVIINKLGTGTDHNVTDLATDLDWTIRKESKGSSYYNDFRTTSLHVRFYKTQVIDTIVGSMSESDQVDFYVKFAYNSETQIEIFHGYIDWNSRKNRNSDLEIEFTVYGYSWLLQDEAIIDTIVQEDSEIGYINLLYNLNSESDIDSLFIDDITPNSTHINGQYDIKYAIESSKYYLQWIDGSPVEITANGNYDLYDSFRDNYITVSVNDFTAKPADGLTDSIVVFGSTGSKKVGLWHRLITLRYLIELLDTELSLTVNTNGLSAITTSDVSTLKNALSPCDYDSGYIPESLVFDSYASDTITMYGIRKVSTNYVITQIDIAIAFLDPTNDYYVFFTLDATYNKARYLYRYQISTDSLTSSTIGTAGSNSGIRPFSLAQGNNDSDNIYYFSSTATSTSFGYYDISADTFNVISSSGGLTTDLNGWGIKTSGGFYHIIRYIKDTPNYIITTLDISSGTNSEANANRGYSEPIFNASTQKAYTTGADDGKVYELTLNTATPSITQVPGLETIVGGCYSPSDATIYAIAKELLTDKTIFVYDLTSSGSPHYKKMNDINWEEKTPFERLSFVVGSTQNNWFKRMFQFATATSSSANLLLYHGANFSKSYYDNTPTRFFKIEDKLNPYVDIADWSSARDVDTALREIAKAYLIYYATNDDDEILLQSRGYIPSTSTTIYESETRIYSDSDWEDEVYPFYETVTVNGIPNTDRNTSSLAKTLSISNSFIPSGVERLIADYIYSLVAPGNTNEIITRRLTFHVELEQMDKVLYKDNPTDDNTLGTYIVLNNIIDCGDESCVITMVKISSGAV